MRTGAPVVCSKNLSSSRPSGSGSSLSPRVLPRPAFGLPPPSLPALSARTERPPRTIAPRETPSLFVIGHGKNGARRAPRSSCTALDQVRKHVIGQLEEANPVGDARLRSDRPSNRCLPRLEAEILDQERRSHAPPRSATGPRGPHSQQAQPARASASSPSSRTRAGHSRKASSLVPPASDALRQVNS